MLVVRVAVVCSRDGVGMDGWLMSKRRQETREANECECCENLEASICAPTPSALNSICLFTC